MSMKRTMALAVLAAILGGVCPVAADAAVTNVRGAQRADSRLVDIYYDLESDEGGAYTVTVEIEGRTDSVAASSFSGDVGEGVTSGRNRHVVWNAGADWPGKKGDVRAVVTATRRDDGTDKGVQLWAGGVYWADRNIGASSPEDYGLYFWWGDTVGHSPSRSTFGFNFTSSNCPTYNKSIGTLLSEGWIVNNNGIYVLAPSHDAAHVLRGGKWRMPTTGELSALSSNCDWTWTTQNGVYGYVVRGRGVYASNRIFLPAAGYGYATSLNRAGSYGNYWSSGPRSDNCSSWYLGFDSSSRNTSTPDYHGNDHRGYGFAVRPVQESASTTVVVTGGSAWFSVDTRDVVISNVRAGQRAGTKYVDVFYDLYASGGETRDVSLNLTKNGAPVQADSLYFYVGSGVTPGKNRYITWDAGADLPENFATCVAEVSVGDVSAKSGEFSLDTRSGEFKIDDVESEFCSGRYGGLGGRKATFLTGVSDNGLNELSFTVKTSGGEFDHILVDAGSDSFADDATFELDMGSFRPGASVTVRAFSKEGKESKPFRLNFDVADYPPLWSRVTNISAHRDGSNRRIVYASSEIATTFLFDEVGDGIQIGDGEMPFSLSPKLEFAQILESDTGQYVLTCDLGGRVGHDITGSIPKFWETLGKKQVFGSVINSSIDAVWSGNDVYEWNPQSTKWVQLPSERGVKLSGSCEFKTRIPQTLNIVYFKIGLLSSGSFLARHDVDDLWYFTANLDPLIALRGTVGAGVEGVACLEGYGQGGVFLNLVSPGMPDVIKEAGFEFKAGWRFVLLGYERNGEATLRGRLFDGQRSARSMLLSAVPVSGGYGDFRLMGRDYGGRSTRGGRLLSASGGTTLGDGYPNPAPSLATAGGTDYLVYLRDNTERSAVNRTELMFRQGADDTWGTAESVWNDGTADFMPKVAAAPGGAVFAAWANAKRVLADSDPLDTMCASMEIAVGVRDASTGEWSCRNLTDDSALDMNPVLRTAADGSAAVAWVRNGAGMFVGSVQNPSTIMLSIYKGGAWLAPIKVADVGTVLSLDLAWNGTNAEVVWTKDADGDLETSDDREAWGVTVANGTVGTVARLSETGVDSARPRVWHDADGSLRKVWLAGGELTADTGTKIAGTDALGIAEDYVLVPRPEGGAMLVWGRLGKNGVGGELVGVTYDTSAGTVGEAVVLGGSDMTQERAITGMVGSDGALRLAYESVAVTTNAEGGVEFGAVELKTLRKGADVDLKVTTVSFGDDVNVGETVDVRVTVSNGGCTEAKGVDVWLWFGEGDGKSLVNVATTNVLPLSSATVSMPWSVGTGLTNMVFTVEVDPQEQIADADRSNNTYVWRPDLGEPQISFSNVQCVNFSDTVRLVNATVCNDGLVPLEAGVRVNFWRGEVGGELLGTDTLGVIAVGGKWGTGIELDVSTLENMADQERVVIELEAGSLHPVTSVTVAKEVTPIPDPDPVAQTYTITYNPGANGTGTQLTDTKTENVSLTLKDAIFTRTGYTQTGWATSDGGSKAYNLSTSYTANAALTLYPFWTANQTIALSKAGWNLVSFNVLPGDASPTNVFGNVADRIQSVVSGTKRWTPHGGGRLTELKIGVGYWVKTTEDNVSWTISGTPNEGVEIQVNAGWNLIGYPLLEGGEPETVLKSASDAGVIESVVSGTKRWTPQNGGRLTEISPGIGYWLKATKSATIRFDKQ